LFSYPNFTRDYVNVENSYNTMLALFLLLSYIDNPIIQTINFKGSNNKSHEYVNMPRNYS